MTCTVDVRVGVVMAGEKYLFVDKFEEVAGDVVRPQWSHAYDRDTHIQPRQRCGTCRDPEPPREEVRPRRSSRGNDWYSPWPKRGNSLGSPGPSPTSWWPVGNCRSSGLGRRIVVPKAALLAMVDLTLQTD